MYERLTAALSQVTSTYELVFVNNGSYDESAQAFDALASADQRVSVSQPVSKLWLTGRLHCWIRLRDVEIVWLALMATFKIPPS